MPDEHERRQIAVDIAELKVMMKNIIDRLENDCLIMKKHIDESTHVRLDIHDNTKFRKGGVKAIWFAVCTAIAAWVRMEWINFFGGK